MTPRNSAEHAPTHTALTLLAAHIPLSLLIDLASPIDSREIYILEPGTADWLVANVA
jgi:hypothetical protein